MANRHVIHAHSSVVTEGLPKLPQSDRIEYGEIAVNYAEGHETLSIKNSNNDIVTFTNDNAIAKIIRDNEKVVSSALNDLNTRLLTVDEQISDIQEVADNKVDKIVSVTYSQLKTMRDNSRLLPGQLYRITDYVTTTTQTDTISAGNLFDVIVLATEVNVLDENARATQHAGDTYFADSNLSAWQLKYCLDNDTDRFAWADTSYGKGVIYYMKDEWNNECPYDFKNIQFKRVKIVASTGYEFLNSFDNTYCGVPITFGGDAAIPTGVEQSGSDVKYFYTFHTSDDFDASVINSLENNVYCLNNIIKIHNYDVAQDEHFKKLILPNNIFIGSVPLLKIMGNVLETDVYDNTFYGSHILCNKIGYESYCNIFGSCFDCELHGRNSQNIVSDSGYITFDKNSHRCYLAEDCSNIYIGEDCYHIHINMQYTSFVVVKSFNKSITLTTNQTISSTHHLKNIIIDYCTNLDDRTMKIITHNTLDDTYPTTYKNANANEILIS